VTGVGVAGMAVRRCRKECEVAILRVGYLACRAETGPIPRGYRLRPGAQLVKERQHAQLALGHVEGGASRVRRLDAMVQVKAFQQLAEGARFARVCHGADRGNELAAALGAGQHGQRRCVGQPDAVDIGDEVEGPVQADAVRRERGSLVGAVGEDQGFAGGESLVAQLVVPGANEAGVGAQNEVGAVVPLGRVGGASTGMVWGSGKKRLCTWRGGMPVMRWIVFKRAPSAANCFASCMARRCRSPRVGMGRGSYRRISIGMGRMNERHGTCQGSRRAQQRHQVGARREQGRVADVDHQGPQLVEAQVLEDGWLAPY
jgi:hypothetical protein